MTSRLLTGALVASAAPLAGRRVRASVLILATAAGLAVLPGVLIGTPTAHAAAAAAYARPRPLTGYCPCTSSLCDKYCVQSSPMRPAVSSRQVARRQTAAAIG